MHRAPIVISLAPISLAVAAVTLASGCKKTVDTAGFEKTITERVTAMGLTPGKVSCPKGVAPEVGKTFTCEVEVDQQTYELDVTITALDKDAKKVNMDSEWKRGPAVLTGKLSALIPAKLNEQFGTKLIALDCGTEPLLFLDADRKASCKLAAGDVTSKLTLTFDDKLAPTAWTLDPPLLGRGKLEAILTPSVQAKTSPDVKVACGASELLPRPDDGIVWCGISNPEKTAKIRVTVGEDLNVKGWEVAE